MIGAYIKLYKDEYIPKRRSIAVYLICILTTFVYSLVASKAWGYTTVMNLIGSIAVFELFKSIKMKSNKWVNKLSTYTFSTYIIHQNSFLVSILYRNLFHTDKYWDSNWMILIL